MFNDYTIDDKLDFLRLNGHLTLRVLPPRGDDDKLWCDGHYGEQEVDQYLTHLCHRVARGYYLDTTPSPGKYSLNRGNGRVGYIYGYREARNVLKGVKDAN